MGENHLEPIWTTLLWLIVICFIVFYPMLISIYVFLPLMIGFMGYVLVLGIERPRSAYIVVALVYLVNLEVNLSLPLFLTVLAILLFYVTIYPQFHVIKMCKICTPLLSVLFIDLLYFVLLLGYDLIFSGASIAVDKLLLYSLVVDMLMVFLL